MPRLVSWNMSHWQKTHEQRLQAWNHLRSLKPDFALLQEAVPQDDLPASRCVFRPGGIGSSRPWGSLVVSFTEDIDAIQRVRASGRAEFDPHQTYPGALAIAKTKSGLTLISLYAVMEHGYAITTLHRQLSDLTPLLDSPQGKHAILAGDLNISTQFREPHRTRHANALDRIGSLGMVDALRMNRPPRDPPTRCPCVDRPCLHVQTQRHPKSATPWQNDYVFVSAALAPNVRACHPIDAGYPWSLSDHCPVVVELTPPPPPPPTPADSPSSAPPLARPRPSPRAAPRTMPPN